MSEAATTSTPPTEELVRLDPPEEAAPKSAGRWQVPLLIISFAVLGAGVYRIVAAYRPTTYEEELSRVHQLHSADVLVLANAYLVDLLKQPERPPEQRAELHRLLAITIYRMELDLQGHAKKNVKAILTNYQQARQLGALLDVDDWIALGDAETWMGDTQAAASSYREALRHCPDRPDRLRRKLLEWEAKSASDLSPESLADVDAILDGEPDRAGCPETGESQAASPANYLWALEYKVEWLLEQGALGNARALIDAGKEHLAGTGELLAVSYLDALCQYREGKPEEAEASLRALLADWNAHDVLWAKSNLLLGQLQQEDARPQLAMSFYEEVLRAFANGELHDAGVLGRAECLASLGDFEGSLEEFSILKEGLLGRGPHRYLDRDAVRTTVTTLGESILHDGRLDLGLRYLELAAELVDPSAKDKQAWYQTRIADSLSRMARLAAKEVEGGEAALHDARPEGEHGGSDAASHPEGRSRDAEQLRIKAAEAYVVLADLVSLDEEGSARALESAADNFDAAGLIDRQIEVLSRFVREHLGHNRRVTALYRLGSAYQAEERYSEAAATYEEAISSYPHLPDALRSMVPMAECLIALGGEQAKRGADMLADIVDDRGPDALFAPQAREYRDALVRLADYYSRAKEEDVPGHLEKAIVRLEEAIARYPDDPEIARWQFLLADAYRGSGRLLATEAASLSVVSERENGEREARRRVERSLAAYDRVIGLLAPHDAGELSEIEQTYLQASYLCRGDCLFDLGRYQDAIEAYRETAWRYEGQPATVSASMQIIHCHLRLGEAVEAGSALARLKWLLRKMPEDAFTAERGMSSKSYWEAMVARMESAGVN